MLEAPNLTPNSNEGIIPQFKIVAVVDKKKSDEAGRPIYRDVEWVDIYIAGDKTTCHSTKVTDEHKHRWPQVYDAFKRGQEMATTGTPIEEWPILTVSQVAELKAINIFSVEDLASLSDTGLQKVGMGARALQAKAKAFIDSAKNGAETQKLASEMAKQAEEIAYLKSEIERISRVYERDIGKTVPNKPGRKKK